MRFTRKNGATSNLFRVMLRRSDTGQGLTGLTNSSSGLVISTIADVEPVAVAYTAAGPTIDTIATLGTFAAPTASHCRFKEVDATNHPGLYELQVADARFSVSNAKQLNVTISGAASLLTKEIVIQLTATDIDDVNGGLQGLKGTTNPTAGALLTEGTGTAQINASGGKVPATVAAADVSGNLPSDAKAINGVSTSSVTTINANVGTTQPVNFTGTAASALVKTDVTDWNGTAVATPNTAGVPLVDVDLWAGHAVSVDIGNLPNVNVADWAGLSAVTNAIPQHAAGSNGGLPTVDASNGVTLRTQDSTSNGTIATLAGSTTSVLAANTSVFTANALAGQLLKVNGQYRIVTANDSQASGSITLDRALAGLAPGSGVTCYLFAEDAPATNASLQVVAASVAGAVGSVAANVTVGGYGAGQDPGTYLTNQGYTTARAGYLDTLNGLVAAVWAAATSGLTTAGSIGLKLKNWVLGSDNKALLSTDAQTGVTIPTVTSVTNPVIVGTNNDKTGYGLSSAERSALSTVILTDTTDTLGADILAIKVQTDKLGFDGSSNVKSTPQTNVNLNLAQTFPTTNTPGTVGDALNAARAQGFGKWTVVGTTLTLYGADGTTVVRSFTLDSATAPTSRT